MQEEKDNEPRAFVTEIDGKMVLVDPDAVAVGRTIAKYNCRNTLESQADHVIRFKQRVAKLGRTASNTVITLVNVDDIHGRRLANALMPGTNWQEIRDRGETPLARGLAGREGIQGYLETFDQEAAAKLRDMTDIIAVVVVDNGVAEVFPA